MFLEFALYEHIIRLGSVTSGSPGPQIVPEYISQIIQFIGSDPFWTGIGIIATVSSLFAAIILAVFFYFKAKRIMKPCYAQRSLNIIKDWESKYQQGLEVKVLGSAVTNFTLTKVAFWNAGRAPINASDIGDPVRITSSENAEILSWKILYAQDPANKIALEPVNDDGRVQVRLDFNYLDQNEGAVVLIPHTGKSDHDIKLEGKIKGADISRRRAGQLYHPMASSMTLSIFIFVSGLGIVALSRFAGDSIALFSLGAILIIPYSFVWVRLMNYLNDRGLPRNLNTFLDEF